MIWDVVVVGAGPAGSLTAYHLAKCGMSVAVVDAASFPRQKPCGGGVQAKALRRIPFNWSSTVKSSLTEAEFTFRLENRFVRRAKEPLVHCVLRSEFDSFMLDTAVRAGAVPHLGVRVCAAEQECGIVRLRTPSGEIHGRYLVGADGANSIVRQALNPRSAFFWQAALFAEFNVPGNTGKLPATMRIDWGSLPAGYAWIFPKGDTINVGAGCPSPLSRHLKDYLRRFLVSEGVMTAEHCESAKFGGHQLPTLTPSTSVAKGRVFLVGDAAGFVEPFTGEGISYACHGAEILAATLAENFDDPDADSNYRSLIASQIAPDILWARRLQSMAVSFPRVFYWLFQNSDDVWAAFCGVLRGESSFEGFRKRVLGPLSLVGSPLDALSGVLERRRMRPQPASEFS